MVVSLHNEVWSGGDFFHEVGFRIGFKLVIFGKVLNEFEPLNETVTVSEAKVKTRRYWGLQCDTFEDVDDVLVEGLEIPKFPFDLVQ